MTFSHISLLKY